MFSRLPLLICLTLATPSAWGAEPEKSAAATSQARPPKDAADLRYWLENMVWYHHYNPAEISQVIGIPEDKLADELRPFFVGGLARPQRAKDAPILTLPYPGGRHPRTGYLEAAINPQRETKISVFTPWDDTSYAVVDVPEAIFSNLGLLYLAHTDVPSMWDKKGIKLEPLEWKRNADGTLEMTRTLPNKVSFGTKVTPKRDVVEMELWLTNGTTETLKDLRVQNCIMLKGAKGFEAQSDDNKVRQGNIVACKSVDGKRWILTGWSHSYRTWLNPKCPCMHSDPQFPDCPAGETKRVTGWVRFYEGEDIEVELKRLKVLSSEF